MSFVGRSLPLVGGNGPGGGQKLLNRTLMVGARDDGVERDVHGESVGVYPTRRRIGRPARWRTRSIRRVPAIRRDAVCSAYGVGGPMTKIVLPKGSMTPKVRAPHDSSRTGCGISVRALHSA